VVGAVWIRSIAVALFVIAIALAWPAIRHLRERPPAPPPSVRLSLAPPPGAELGSGDEALDAAISPDERAIVFVATTDGTPRLWRRLIDGERAEPLAGTDGAQFPAWKPTGSVLAFFSEQKLKQLSLTDNAVRDLADAPAPSGASWLADGSLLFAPDSRGPIRRLSGGTASDATQLQPSDRAHVFPIAIGSRRFVYTAVRNDGSRVARIVDEGVDRELATTTGHAQLIGDLLLYTRDGILFAQRYDPASGALAGRPTTVASGAGVSTSGRSLFAASPRLLLSAAFAPRARTVTWLALDGKPPTTAGEPGDYWQVRLSPDDRFIALTVTTPLLRTLDIVVAPSDGDGSTEQITRALAADTDPVWAPDGSRLLFRSFQDGPPHLFTHAVRDKDANDEAFERAPVDDTPTDWQNDRVLFHAPDARNGFDIWSYTPSKKSRDVLVKSAFNDIDARWSPDRQWVAYVSDESGRPDIYVVTSSGQSRVRASFGGGTRPRWSRDGRSLFFLRGTRIMRAAIDSGASPLRFATPQSIVDVPGVRDFDVAHRRDALVALMPTMGPGSPSVSVLVDWRSLVAAP
jgi:eukaryotic-like serine/threonine-protein kinase